MQSCNEDSLVGLMKESMIMGEGWLKNPNWTLSGPIETKCLVHVIARSMVNIRDLVQ